MLEPQEESRPFALFEPAADAGTAPKKYHAEPAIRRAMRSVIWYASEGVTLREIIYDPDERLRGHDHPDAFLCFILEGGFSESVGRKSIEVEPGFVSYLPPELHHRNRFSDTGVRCLRLEISPSRLLDLNDRASDKPFQLAGGEASWSFLRLYRSCLTANLTPLCVEELIGTLLTATNQLNVKSFGCAQPPRWLARARDYLRAQTSRTASLSELARVADVHPAHLSRVFRQHYGCSIGEWFQTSRMVLACRLLAESRLPLVQIAHDLGFSDQSHFTRLFTRRLGMPPGTYRAARRPFVRIVQD
jgi:AraC family transcriptional regulator